MQTTFIGGGNMAQALIGGLLAQGTHPGQLLVVEHHADTRAHLQTTWPGLRVLAEMDQTAARAGVIVLAVKPQQLRAVAETLAPWLDDQLVLSIAAGVRTAVLSAWLEGYSRLVRAMPNTPAMVGEGITGLFAMAGVSATHREMARQIMLAAGSAFWLTHEADLDAVTAVSGSGPAYVFYFMEAIEQAALDLGLSAELARELVLATFSGASALLRASEDAPSVLRERVTSPGGTTESALNSMRAADVSHAIKRAVQAAADRSRELGDMLQ